jgi:hypothetical protein
VRPVSPDSADEMWRAFIASIRRRLGMYVYDRSFAEACALLIGFDQALGAGTIDRFQQWMGRRHPGHAEHGFPALVVREVFPADDFWARTRALSKEETDVTVTKLFGLFELFLDEDLQASRARGSRS